MCRTFTNDASIDCRRSKRRGWQSPFRGGAALGKAGGHRERKRIGASQRDNQRIVIRGAYRVSTSRRRVGKRICPAEAFSVILIECISLNSGGRAAGRRIGRGTAR